MIGSEKYQLSTGAAAYYDFTSSIVDKSKYPHITNPCLTKDTWILTTEGPRQIADLINKEFTAIVNGEKYKSTGFWSTGIKKIYQLKTDRGYSIKATENHKFYVETSRKRKFGGGYNITNQWKEVSELKNKDKIVLNNQRGNSWEGYGDSNLGWLLGQIVGDGGYNDENGITYLRFWGKSQNLLANYARDIIEDNFKVRSDFGEGGGFNRINRCSTVQCKALTEFASRFIESKTKDFKESLEKETSSLFIKGFIKGFFDADGTVANNPSKGSSIRLAQNDLEKLYSVQRMLSRFGIISTIYTNRRKAGYRLMPDSNRELKEYCCEAQHELIISKDNINEYYDQIGFNEPCKQDKLEEIINNQKEVYKERFLSNLEEIIYLGEEEVFDCTVNGIHAFDANGLMSHNCGEITLNAKGGYCVISDIVPFFCNSLDEVKEVAKQAVRFLIRTNLMDAIYADEVKRTNRIGVGMTGLHEFAWKFFGYGFYDLIDESKSQMFWDFIGELRQTVEIEAASYSQKLGLNTPHTCTTMKPSGSISKLYALTEGAHLAARKFYLRWVQFQNNDPLLEQYREEGYPVKELTTYPNISIVGFPTRPLIASLGMKDKLVTAQEASPEDQYKWLMLLEKYWLGEGNNQISYCLAGDKKHLITTSTGFRRIENMVKSEVPDRFGEKQNVIDLIENGKKETIKMTLTNGLYIQGTKDHKVLTLDNFNNYVWTRLEDLRINDLVLRRKNDNIFSSTYSLLPQNTYSRNNFKDITIPEKVTNEFAEFLGMLMSDGSINENGFCLHNEDLEVLDRFGFLVKSLFGITGIRKRDLNTQKMYDFEFYSRELTHWLLYDLKIPKYHDDNYILDCILQSPKSAIQAFIKGHTLDGYNCEDYLYPLCTVSKQMAYDICILMISMGYNASVSYKEGREYYFTETNQGIGKSQYSVRIPKTEISKFLQEIKFAEERKNVEANLNIKDKNIKNNGKDNLLFFNPFKEYYLKNKKTMSNKYGPKFNRLMYQDRRFISKEKAYEFFGDIDEFKHIFEDKNIISTPVKSVEIIDALIHTYDISVEESHEYLANTIIVHNTLKISTEKYTLEEFRETFKKYQSKIRCCSVLPLASNTELKTLYEYLPEEDVTEEYFMEIQNRIRKNNDVGFAMSELMCDGGACPL